MKRVYLAYPGIWNEYEIKGLKSCVKSLGQTVKYSVAISPKCNQVLIVDYKDPLDKWIEDNFIYSLEDAICGNVYITELIDTADWEQATAYFQDNQ